MEQAATISSAALDQFVEGGRSVMQISRRHDEMVFCHSMGTDELKAHLERVIVPGDCQLCEWFGRSAK